MKLVQSKNLAFLVFTLLVFQITSVGVPSASAVGPITVGTNPTGIAYDPVGDQIFVTNYNGGNTGPGNSISVFPASAVNPVPTLVANYSGVGPVDIVYDPGVRLMFVANFNSGTVSVIDPAHKNVIQTYPVGSLPHGLAYDSNLNEIYVTNYGASVGTGTISVINDALNRPVNTFSAGQNNPLGIAYDPVNFKMYVANYNGGSGTTVSVFSDANNGLVSTIPVGTGPDRIAYDSTQHEMYVTNITGSTIYYIPTSGSSSFLVAGSNQSGPAGIVYDSTVNQMYVANLGLTTPGTTVSVINDAAHVVVPASQSTVGSGPYYLAYDPVGGKIFVTNFYSNNVSVISDGSGGVVSGSGIISINGDNTKAQTINGVPGSTTVSTSAGTTTIDLASIITKILTFTNNINVGANIVSSGASGSTLRIIPATNGAICIGTGC